MDYKGHDWSKVTDEEYVSICYPISGQHLNIHSEDVRVLVPLLRAEKPKVIVEIGAGFGTSSKLFAGIAKEFCGRLFSIDPVPRKEWADNLDAYDLRDRATMIPGASPWISWPDDEEHKIDVLFIDGWHNFRNVMVDFFYWQKYVREGGIIIFHDTRAFPAVMRAVNEILKTEIMDKVADSPSRVGMEIFRKVADRRGKTVFFGPWVGEFGWECCWWQGWARKESKKYDHVIVSSYPGHEGFYEDFADEFVAHGLRGQPMCGFANGLTGEFDYPSVTKVCAPLPKKFIPNEDQEFVQFGQNDPDRSFDVLIGVSGHWKKQYPADQWAGIMKFLAGKKVACFGKTGEYPDGIVDGSVDIRDIPLKQLMRYMAGSKVVMGPCTGAIHLASYCNANIVVWCDAGGYTFNQTLRQRFETILNPFNNPVTVIDKFEYNPPVEEVTNALAAYL